MASVKLHKVYERLLRHHPIGKALYWPVPTTDLAPGCLGYFNADGYWRRLMIDMNSGAAPFHGDLSAEDTFHFDYKEIKSSNIQNIEFDVAASTE